VRWKCESESGPLAALCPGGDRALVAGDDPVDDGQSNSGSRILIHAVQALKHTKQFVSVLHIEPDTVVLDFVAHQAPQPWQQSAAGR
jgi:hypothetical protein